MVYHKSNRGSSHQQPNHATEGYSMAEEATTPMEEQALECAIRSVASCGDTFNENGESPHLHKYVHWAAPDLCRRRQETTREANKKGK